MTAIQPSPIPAVVYLRVSTEEQAREDRSSLDQQREGIEALAGRLGCQVAQTFSDAGVSGGTADRPAFQALIAYCRAHPQEGKRPGYILVLNDSRWGRFTDPDDATYWRAAAKHLGWIVRFAEADDTENLTARGVLRAIYSAQATAYREQIKANAKRGAMGTAAQGYWQVEAPMGYRREASEPGHPSRVLEPGQRKADSERVRLTPGPDDEVGVVRWMFTAYAAGNLPLGKLADALELRYPSRRWSRSTVQQVLKNRTYLGEVIWGRRPHDKIERMERAVRDRSEWIIVPDAHPALIDPDLFELVQARLQENKKQLRHARVDYLLSGLLTCAHCGNPYIGSGGPVGPEGDVDRYRFYRDRGTDRRYGACPGNPGLLSRRYIEPKVLQVIGRVIGQPETRKVIGDALDARLEAMRHVGPVDDSPARKTRLLAERERLVAALGAGVLTSEEATIRLDVIRREIDAITTQAQVQRFGGKWADRLAGERHRLLDLLADFPAAMARLAGAQRRDLLRPWLQSAVVDKIERVVTLEVSRVPALGLLCVAAGTLGPDGQYALPRLVVTRHIPMPVPGFHAGKRRHA